MTASFTNQEFQQYISKLEFVDLEGMIGFIRAYVDDLIKTDSNNPEYKDKYIKYCFIMAEFGPVLLKFAELALNEKTAIKHFNDKLYQPANNSFH